jgi:hypothetical protein
MARLGYQAFYRNIPTDSETRVHISRRAIRATILNPMPAPRAILRS